MVFFCFMDETVININVFIGEVFNYFGEKCNNLEAKRWEITDDEPQIGPRTFRHAFSSRDVQGRVMVQNKMTTVRGGNELPKKMAGKIVKPTRCSGLNLKIISRFPALIDFPTTCKRNYRHQNT